jgi:hypothetical protein
MALGWNADGYWVVQKAATLDNANDTALAKCNDKFGNCELSSTAVDPAQFACMAIGRGNVDTKRLFAATGGSIDEARKNVNDQLSNADMTGDIEFTDCNGAVSAAN